MDKTPIVDELHSCQATRWVSGIEINEFSNAWMAKATLREGNMPEWATAFQQHNITTQWRIDQDVQRFIIPSETPEHVVALVLAIARCDVNEVERLLESM